MTNQHDFWSVCGRTARFLVAQCRRHCRLLKRRHDQYQFKSIAGEPTIKFDFQKARNGEPQLIDELAVDKAKCRYAAHAAPCPQCKAPPGDLNWEHYSSPGFTWGLRKGGSLSGRAGWMTTCEKCPQAVDFFIEQMS